MDGCAQDRDHGDDHGDGRTALARRLGRDRAVTLVVHALALLDEAAAESGGQRFVLAHLAALRAAGAVLADHGRPPRRRGTSRPLSAWVQLPRVVPEMASWALLFGGAAPLRAAVENGRRTVEPAAADRHLDHARAFVAQVSSSVGAGAPQVVGREPAAGGTRAV